MRELSVAEQSYQAAVMAVIGDGLSISQVAEKVGVSPQTLHAWLVRYGVRRSRKWKRRERGTAMKQWQMDIGT
jgi:transposase